MDYVIREGKPEDAAACIAYVQALAEERDIDIPLAPGEFTYTVEQEAAIIQEYLDSPNSVYLVAEADGQIVGVLTCKGGKRAANRHAAGMGITVRRGYRGQGIGGALLSRLIAWAQEGGIVKRIQLEVYVRNQRAIHLYLKHGFQVEGRRRHVIYQDEQFLDDYVMGLLV
jgi:ribosomal protein S18 acetylase RimI-like enzyme